ncbi:hypothetical protein Tco_0572208, partial [Tanacetum coccineum]
MMSSKEFLNWKKTYQNSNKWIILQQVDHTPTILESIKSEVPEAVNKYLGSTLGDTLQK